MRCPDIQECSASQFVNVNIVIASDASASVHEGRKKSVHQPHYLVFCDSRQEPFGKGYFLENERYLDDQHYYLPGKYPVACGA